MRDLVVKVCGTGVMILQLCPICSHKVTDLLHMQIYSYADASMPGVTVDASPHLDEMMYERTEILQLSPICSHTLPDHLHKTLLF